MSEKLHVVSRVDDVTVATYNPFEGKNVLICHSGVCGGPECLERQLKGTVFKMIDGHMCGAGRRFDIITDENGTIIGVTIIRDCKAVFANPEKYPEFFESELSIRG